MVNACDSLLEGQLPRNHLWRGSIPPLDQTDDYSPLAGHLK